MFKVQKLPQKSHPNPNRAVGQQTPAFTCVHVHIVSIFCIKSIFTFTLPTLNPTLMSLNLNSTPLPDLYLCSHSLFFSFLVWAINYFQGNNWRSIIGKDNQLFKHIYMTWFIFIWHLAKSGIFFFQRPPQNHPKIIFFLIFNLSLRFCA